VTTAHQAGAQEQDAVVGAGPRRGREERRAGRRVILHSMGVRRDAYTLGAIGWLAFFVAPAGIGLLLELLFDAIVADGPALTLLALVAGAELGRAIVLLPTTYVFEPFWGGTETALRTNVLRAQLEPDPDERGPDIGDPAAAVPLFREDPEHVALAGDQAINATGGILLGVLSLIVVARIGWAVALAVAVPLVVAAFVSGRLAPVVRARRAEDRAVTEQVTSFLGDAVAAATTVTTAGASETVLARWAQVCDRRRVTAVRDRVASALLPAVAGAAGDLALASGLVLAAVTVGGDLTPGQVALLAVYSLPLANVTRHWGQFQAARRHADVSVMRMRGAVRDGDVARLTRPVAPVQASPPPLRRVAVPARAAAPTLELRRLVTAAPDGSTVGPVDLRIPAGQLTVITGAVGSGKSTLARALAGLAPLISGELRWDADPVDPARWMVPPRTAYVAQVPTLFSESIEDNLRLGWDVDPEVLLAALDQAAAAELPDLLEDGMRTRLGPRGVRLSGGQAHRVALARALVTSPAVLIADDLSAALDAPTETRLLDGLLARADRTVVLVSHRPAVLRRADVILELNAR
jgi:ATP-binding cassette, subfamily B, bacterial